MIKTVEIDLDELAGLMVEALVDVKFLKSTLTPEDLLEVKGNILDSLIPEGIEERFTTLLARDLSMELVAGMFERGND